MINSVSTSSPAAVQSKDVKDTDKKPGLSEASIRAQTNQQILQASLQVSISSGDKPMQLLFRTAIDKINEVLKPEFGDDAIKNAMGQDNSPEGTAGRIVALSTGFYDAFAKQRLGQDPDKIAEEFTKVIRGGVEQGFKEARDILKSLQVLDGSIASNVDKTYDLVQKGLDDFLAGKKQKPAEAK
ncbi:DUF5610 domain-containing protein [Iodobacter sp. LRB]|uniref:DUF5610 domain-containing protein n=1 Tax=unclassified Iodobacter TaxID=235634 RepID=UPI000C0F6767|nr:DUF5610 domain-containing protein [Iodobacter sp. BJB302]PHU99693.1 hypothetical protein CSQ88_21155 [Iodobacter sp. BJB302]